VLAALLSGNERFAAGEAAQRDITARIAASAQGQYPKVVILSCFDSRVPVEKIFDVQTSRSSLKTSQFFGQLTAERQR